MGRLSCKECKIGMKVLLTHPDNCYEIGPNNPATNTEWECTGIIVEKGSQSIGVTWSKGYRNMYRGGELSAAENGSYIDIW